MLIMALAFMALIAAGLTVVIRMIFDGINLIYAALASIALTIFALISFVMTMAFIERHVSP
jgi:hypothetical protein